MGRPIVKVRARIALSHVLDRGSSRLIARRLEQGQHQQHPQGGEDEEYSQTTSIGRVRPQDNECDDDEEWNKTHKPIAKATQHYEAY